MLMLKLRCSWDGGHAEAGILVITLCVTLVCMCVCMCVCWCGYSISGKRFRTTGSRMFMSKAKTTRYLESVRMASRFQMQDKAYTWNYPRSFYFKMFFAYSKLLLCCGVCVCVIFYEGYSTIQTSKWVLIFWEHRLALSFHFLPFFLTSIYWQEL